MKMSEDEGDNDMKKMKVEPLHFVLDLLLKMPLYLDIQTIGRISQTCRSGSLRFAADEVWRP